MSIIVDFFKSLFKKIKKLSRPYFSLEENELKFKIDSDTFYKFPILNIETKTRYDSYILDAYTLKADNIHLEYIHTDNPIFNTVINNKIEYAKSEDIIITTGLHKTLKPMHGNDLYTIMGNVLDNAIEAELKEEPCNREIEIRSVWNGNDMIITVENYISKSVLNDNKELHTSKQDKKSHGLGIQIIKKLVKKNNGTCDYHEEGNMFCCEIRW